MQNPAQPISGEDVPLFEVTPGTLVALLKVVEAEATMARGNGRPGSRQRRATTEDGTWLRERFGLTAREARVALLIAEGHAAKEVAVTLGVTVFTVRAHLRNIFAKIGVGRQAALVRVVLRSGPRD